MRCPKCHYLSFDPEPRCKNCGYDLDVADAELAFKAAEDYGDAGLDLELRRAEPTEVEPVSLELRRDTPVAEPSRARRVQRSARRAPAISADDDDVWPARSTTAAAVAEPPARAPEVTFRIEPVREIAEAEPESPPAAVAASVVPQEPEPAPVQAPVVEPPSSPHPTTELPLFVRDAPAPPRAPLSVRRTMTEPVRARAAIDPGLRGAAKDLRVGPLDRDLLDDLRRVEREEAALATAQARAREITSTPDAEAKEDDDPEDVPATQRLAAAALDGVLLASIGTVALWATMRVTGAGITAFGTSSIVAFLIFLAGVSVSYLLMFTAAGGQTIGKMLMGLRVVGGSADSADEHLTMSQAALRAVLAPLSVIALGLGWLPALFGRGLALHDRLAHTRVVRA